MKYPDFAFYWWFRWVLFFWNCFVTTLSYYWGATILLHIYQKKISFRRKLCFSFLSAFLLNIFVIYGYAYLYGYLSHQYRWSLDHHEIRASLGKAFRYFIIVMNPFCYIALYRFGVYILKLPPFRSVKMMHLAYVYFICCSILIKVGSLFVLPTVQDPRGYNGLQDFLQITLGTIIIYVFYKIIMKLIEVFNFILVLPMNTVVIHIKKSLFQHFLLSSIIYIFVVLFIKDPDISGARCLMLALILFAYMLITLMLDYYDLQKQNLKNKKEYLNVLGQSVEQFRGIKHDFNNILQTYSGYLSVKDYEKLEIYHKKVVDTMHHAEVSLDLNQRILENPSFWMLLNKKMALAQQNGVVFQIALQCKMNEIPMNEIDFTTVCACFLDMSIRYAEQTLLKNVHIFAYQKKKGDYLIIVSNNADNILSTTVSKEKEGQFIGELEPVYEILSRYGNSTVNVVQKGEFLSIYFEIKSVERRNAS